MDRYTVSYIDEEGFEDEIEVEAEDEYDAEEAAHGELTARYPSTDTDEWDIVSAVRAAAPAAP